MTALKMLLISLCCLLAGAAGVCAVLSGVASIPLAPLLAVFAWFYLIPIYLVVAAMWVAYVPRLAGLPWNALFIISGGLLGGCVMVLCGLGASDTQIRDGMVLGGLLAGTTSNLLIVLMKHHNAERTGPANGSQPNGPDSNRTSAAAGSRR